MNLENRFFYRLVKVIYSFCLLLSSAIIIFVFYANIPSKIVDNNASSIHCNTGKNYSFTAAKLFINPYSYALDNENNRNAKIFCLYGPPISDPTLLAKPEKTIGSKKNQLKNSSSDWEVITVPEEKNYHLNLKYQVRDLWLLLKTAVIYYLFAFLCVYMILNIIKETLMYLAFGRKFKWNRLFVF